MRRTLLAVHAVTLGLLLAPASAGAQSPGVNYDPSSPAGKEYALPIEQATKDSGATAKPAAPAAAPSEAAAAPELFGVGIKAPKAKRPATPEGGAARPATPAAGSPGSPLPAPPSAEVRVASGGRHGLLVGGAIAGGAVLLGLAGGLLARRTSRS